MRAGWDLPDDWDRHRTTCAACGARYHASEGACYALRVCRTCDGPEECNDMDDGRCQGCAETMIEAVESGWDMFLAGGGI